MAVPIWGLLAVLIAVFAIIGAFLAVVLFVARGSGGSQKDNPNLRPCPDCGHYISVRANGCPQCGGPVKTLQ